MFGRPDCTPDGDHRNPPTWQCPDCGQTLRTNMVCRCNGTEKTHRSVSKNSGVSMKKVVISLVILQLILIYIRYF